MRDQKTGAAEVSVRNGNPFTRRRKLAVTAGATGLLGLLSAGVGLLAWDDPTSPERRLPVAAAPADSAGAPTAAPAPAGGAGATTAAASRAPEREIQSLMEAGDVSRAVAEKWAAARRANVEAGTTVRRPLVGGGGVVNDADVVVRTVDGIRVVSADQDLTGQRELGWVADRGVPVGTSRCSQTFRLSRDEPARKRPTLLVCWRVSADRSVFTVATGAEPSKRGSVALIDKVWAGR
ncbi:hypothetical protein [Actinoplanes sp. M2I2]|uniref:hypothetical protein n=1 Tax=Actinoplanes sp. M2I2 TaxID=1734444 RepID=UPI0020206919|nr:hypothetical protein [Actinoplanes sp. M2I2]